jgi:hypothetical protein
MISWVSFTRDGRRAFFSLGHDNAIAESTLGNPACEPANESLRDFWSGDGIADNSASGRHGSIENGVQFAPGLVGQAFSFDANDGYIQVGGPAMARWTLPAPSTLSLWIKLRRAAGQRELLVEQRQRDGTPHWRMLRSPDGRIGFEASARPAPFAISTQAPVSSGAWLHVRIVFTESQVRLYLNGVRQSERDFRLVPDEQSTLRFGGGALGGSFAGLIDEVTVHTGAPTDPQILASHRAFVSACVSPETHGR